MNIESLPYPEGPTSGGMTRRQFVKWMAWMGALSLGTVVCGPLESLTGQPQLPEQKDQLKLTDPDVIAVAVSAMGLSLEQSELDLLTSNGLNAKKIKEAVVGGEAKNLIVIKGGTFPPPVGANYTVAFEEGFETVYKIAPSPGMEPMLERGMESRKSVLAMFSGQVADDILMPEMVTIEIGGGSFRALKMSNIGPTAYSYIRSGDLKTAAKLYEQAYQTSVELLIRNNRYIRDVNPGNIHALRLRDGGVVGVPFDFEEATALSSASEDVVYVMLAHYQKAAKRAGLGVDLKMLPGQPERLLAKVPGVSTGRVVLAGMYIDYSFSVNGIDPADVAQMKNQVVEQMDGMSLPDEVNSLWIDTQKGQVEVTLKRVPRRSEESLLEAMRGIVVDDVPDSATTPSRLKGVLPVLNFIMMGAVGTVELPGWGGPEFIVNKEKLEAVSDEEFSAKMKPGELYKQIEIYRKDLLLRTRTSFGTLGPGYEKLFEDPTVAAILHLQFGEDAANLFQLYYDVGLGSVIHDKVLDAIQDSPLPFQASFSFASPFPGIPGDELRMPLWMSSHKEEDGVDILRLWMGDWDSFLETAGYGAEPLQLQLVAEYIRDNSGWELSAQDGGRMGAGFRLSKITPNSDAVCELYIPDVTPGVPGEDLKILCHRFTE